MPYAIRSKKPRSVMQLLATGRFLGVTALICLLSLSASCGSGDEATRDPSAGATGSAGATAPPPVARAGSPVTEAQPAPSDASAESPQSATVSREDLERFQGVYGNDSGPNANRNFFVYATCDAQLGVGAMWGDVAPWILTATGETSFREAHSNPYNPPIEANFRVDGNGNGTELSLNSHFKDRGWMKRLGDLPEGWAPDCEPAAKK